MCHAFLTAKTPLAKDKEKREKSMAARDYVLVPHEKPYKYEEGGLHVTRGSAWTAPGCHLGCGVLLYTDDEGKLVKVEGDPENPFNEGRLCCRCLALTRQGSVPCLVLHRKSVSGHKRASSILCPRNERRFIADQLGTDRVTHNLGEVIACKSHATSRFGQIVEGVTSGYRACGFTSTSGEIPEG